MLHIRFRDVGNTEFIPHHNKYFLGLLSAVGDVAGGLIAKKASDNAAKASLQATRETNAANLKHSIHLDIGMP